MAAAIDELIRISGDPLAGQLIELPRQQLEGGGARAELDQLLRAKNGFLAFESALLVLPSRTVHGVPGLTEWNAPHGWRRHYDSVPNDLVFFALDLFCGQFGVSSDGVLRLDLESGKTELVAADLQQWGARILANYDFETGWSLAHDWQVRFGALPIGSRLLGRKPFVLGGAYEVENLVPLPLAEAAEKLGGLYRQIRDVPDGMQITVKNWL